MRQDIENLSRIQRNEFPFLYRLYRFNAPTVTYGRLQNPEDVRRVSPAGWPLVQRPTGGGIVFHENDLCFSIAWRPGETVIPDKPTEQYQWIHTVVLNALAPVIQLNRFSCQQVEAAQTPFHERQCFQEPVACDLLSEGRKIVGGALAHRRDGILYQGSIQMHGSHPMDDLLVKALESCIIRR